MRVESRRNLLGAVLAGHARPMRRLLVGAVLAALGAFPLPATAGQAVSAGGLPTARVGGSPTVSAGGLPTARVGGLPAVSVVGLPTARVGGLPAVSAGGLPTARVGGLPAVSAGGLQAVETQAGNEIDRFMERVLDNRDASWRRIGDFVLREVLTLDIDGPADLPVAGFRREYEWYVREDVVVRSPRRFDGVDIGEADRREYEAEWLRRRERREEERRRPVEEAEDRRETEAVDPEPLDPEFITDAGYFLEFPFEPGNYYLAGYETLAGREVVKIEYYPTDLFDDDSEPESERERRIAEGFAKTSLVTLWIDPEVHEVVRYTFENVGLDFLPGRWLVRVDGWRASVEMAQPIAGVWLPSRMILTGGATTALGAFELRLTREYSDYREAVTSGRVVGTGDVVGDRR